MEAKTITSRSDLFIYEAHSCTRAHARLLWYPLRAPRTPPPLPSPANTPHTLPHPTPPSQIFVCFWLGIVTLFVARNPNVIAVPTGAGKIKVTDDDTFRNTAWSSTKSTKTIGTFGKVTFYCNAQTFKDMGKDTERNTMIAMVSIGTR